MEIGSYFYDKKYNAKFISYSRAIYFSRFLSLNLDWTGEYELYNLSMNNSNKVVEKSIYFMPSENIYDKSGSICLILKNESRISKFCGK